MAISPPSMLYPKTTIESAPVPEIHLFRKACPEELDPFHEIAFLEVHVALEPCFPEVTPRSEVGPLELGGSFEGISPIGECQFRKGKPSGEYEACTVDVAIRPVIPGAFVEEQPPGLLEGLRFLCDLPRMKDAISTECVAPLTRVIFDPGERRGRETGGRTRSRKCRNRHRR